MKRATRNKLLVWIIFVGLLNFGVYTFFYWYFQGDARNGFLRVENGQVHYYLRGHFIHTPDGRASAPVSRAVWIYSFVHSISIWPTIAAVLVSMFILARPHIIATIKSDSLIAGRTLVNACMAIVIAFSLISSALFVLNLIQALRAAAIGHDFGV